MPAMTLNDGTMWEPTPEQVRKWIDLYPAVDVPRELNAMVGWLDANPKRRKTSRGIATFCNNWLKRAQDKGGQGLAQRKEIRECSTRDMSAADDLTHNFLGDPAISEHFLEKFGQVFIDGKRITR